MAKPFLFTLNTQDQLDLFEAAATATGLPHFVLEKDYYVTLTLKLLFERLKPYHTERTSTPFMFKGGTTLSKVYGCIDRMSEDIDLSLDMNFLGYPEPANHEGTTATSKRVALLNEATQAAVSDVIAPFLRDELLEINSSFGVSVLKNGMDIEVQYPQIFEAPGGGYINPRVLLECGGKAGLEPSARHETWFQAISAAPLVSNAPEYSSRNISAGVRNPSRTLGRLFNAFSTFLMSDFRS